MVYITHEHVRLEYRKVPNDTGTVYINDISFDAFSQEAVLDC